MDSVLGNRLWRFSYVLIIIIILWAIWIFGFVWQYYDDTISFDEGGILLGLLFIIVMVRETALSLFKKEGNKYT